MCSPGPTDQRTVLGIRRYERAISSAEHVGYWIARRSRFCGREMRFGDWARDHVLRLFQRERARFTDDAVHEQVKVEGSTGRLRPHLQHDALRSPHDVLRKIDQYSELWAAEAHDRGRRCSYASAVGHGAWTFIRSGILLGGFLDGPLGIALAIAAAEGAYYRYLKLYQLSREGGANGR